MTVAMLEGRRLHTKLADGVLANDDLHRHEDDARRGSAMLRDAILEKHFGVVIPKADRAPKPLKRVELCPTCLGPIKPPPAMIASIQKTVAAYYSISADSMTSRVQCAEVARPRQVAMYLAVKLTRHSIAEVGRRFKRDHTTVLHALKAVEKRCQSDDQEAFDVALLRERLSA